MIIREYTDEDGSSPYQKWFKKLDSTAKKKVTVAVARLVLGNTSNIKWFDGIGEYRINWGPGYRIYLAQDGKRLILLFGGGTKKSQSSDIQKAKKLHQQYKADKRKKNGGK